MKKMKFAKPDESKVISVTLMTDDKAEAVERYKNSKMVGCTSKIHEGEDAERYGAKYMVSSSGPISKLKQAIDLPDDAWQELIHG